MGLLRAPDRARELGRRARERQAADFDLSVTTHLVEELYEELFAAKCRRERLR